MHNRFYGHRMSFELSKLFSRQNVMSLSKNMYTYNCFNGLPNAFCSSLIFAPQYSCNILFTDILFRSFIWNLIEYMLMDMLVNILWLVIIYIQDAFVHGVCLTVLLVHISIVVYFLGLILIHIVRFLTDDNYYYWYFYWYISWVYSTM